MENLRRRELFEANRWRLEQLAYRAIHTRGMDPDQFVIVCIEVDDPSWRDLAEGLMPGQDWQKVRDQGQVPIARGIVDASIREYLGTVVPDVREALFSEIPKGFARAMMMGDGGMDVYNIEPMPETEQIQK